jgi:hypothetical protein
MYFTKLGVYQSLGLAGAIQDATTDEGTALALVDILTCSKVSCPFRCEDQASLRGFDSCHDRIRRSSDSWP